MSILEIVFRFFITTVFISYLFYVSWIGYQIFKSDKYLQVKQQYRNVDIAKADLKFEYKMAVLNYKSNRDTRQHRDILEYLESCAKLVPENWKHLKSKENNND